MGLIIRNSEGMFHYYAPSTISSGTNDRIKTPAVPEGQVQSTPIPEGN